MKRMTFLLKSNFALLLFFFCGDVCAKELLFPLELTQFQSASKQPVFEAAGEGTWEVKIRERGWILKEGDQFKMWYTGYDGTREGQKKLGYATSCDGIVWKRHSQNPIYSQHWVEDMMVVKHNGKYIMFAEGANDQAQMLESADGILWKRIGTLDIRTTNGKPIVAGPYGTPTVWVENGTWYLFYERYDSGVWLATSKDRKVWTHVQDDPVLKKGPGHYDSVMIAMNQVLKHKGRYYASYHGTGSKTKPRLWVSAIATSTDLVHWRKYKANPLRPASENKSSGVFVRDGKRFLFYTMHGKVELHKSVK